MLGLLVLLFFARSLVTFPIEHVDAAFKYLAAADVVRGNGWVALLHNHHTMRWSEVLPQALVTWLTRFRYEGLYLLPLLAFAGYCTAFWRGLGPVLSRSQQVLLLALLFLEPMALKHTGQLLNPPFGVFYAALAVSLLAQPGRLGWLRVAGATGLFFCAYGAHSTYLAFSAGGIAWLLVFRRQPLHALAMAAGLATLMAGETWVFRQIADEVSGGRLGALADGGHWRAVQHRFPAVAFHELFTRWGRLPWFSLFMSAGYVGCLVWLGLDRRARLEAPPFLWLCLLTGGAYACGVTFAVVGIDPIRPMMPLYPMYLAAFIPWAVVASVYLVAGLESRLRPRTRLVLELAAVTLMVALLAVAASRKAEWDTLVNYRMSAFMWRADAQVRDMGHRFRTGEILLTGSNRLALEMLFAYRRPVRTVHHARVPYVASAARIQREVRCVRGIRKIPLPRNIVDCQPRQVRAARAAGARWRKPRTARQDDSL